MTRKAPPPPDPENGLWQGRSVARRFVSPDGMTVLVGKTAEDNDVLSLKLASPRDFWFHVAAESGSHVIVRNPEGLDRLPKVAGSPSTCAAPRTCANRAASRRAKSSSNDSRTSRSPPGGRISRAWSRAATFPRFLRIGPHLLFCLRQGKEGS
jgi:hypothetical protein